MGLMFAATTPDNLTKPDLYHTLQQQLRALIENETDPIANMANCAALIFNSVPRLNWAGFYLLKGNELVLGPFQGKPACIRITLGSGVCGTAAKNRETIRVHDVTEFSGHIACDPDSRSEIVFPLLLRDQLIGVLDLDSPEPGRFDSEDETGLSALAAIIAAKL
jgi:L-methionine (R)-S-oxide reductase